jgi:hypothetical protein
MKFNKWTVALAALGVVSLASVARAEEKTSSVLTALSSTTISGTVDTSMEWNPGNGNANVAPYKFNSPSMQDGFNLDVIQLTIEKPLDETEWAAGYRFDLWFGPYANQLNTSSPLSTGSSDFGIRQAYVALRAPVGNGLDFKVGVFDSIIGYESVDSSKDPNFTRSYGHSIEPQTETGILMSYRFCDCFSLSAGVADTVGPQINQRAFGASTFAGFPVYGPDSETYKTWMGSLALTAPDSWGFLAGSTLYGGAVNGYNSNPTYNAGNQLFPPVSVGKGPVYSGANMSSWYAGATVATPLKALRLGVAWDCLDLYNWPGDTWAIGGYASFQATEKFSLHLRGEYLKDSSHVLFASPTDQVLDVTATAQYDLWKNVITRIEFRWDHSLNDTAAFGGTIPGVPQAVNAYMLGANIIYKF